MRISAIQTPLNCCPVNNYRKNSKLLDIPPQDLAQDTVSFKGNEIKKGFGIGAIIGAVALSIISGGAATPLAYGVYAATIGTAGGMFGNAIKNTKNQNTETKGNS